MRKIVLLDGSEYYGKGFGSLKECIGEIVVESSMSGYQKSISDARNQNKLLLFTYPLIGNYGMNNEQQDDPKLNAVIVREYCEIPSNFRSSQNIESYLKEFDIVGISEIDTRSLFRKIRDKGRQYAIICDTSVSKEEAILKIQQYLKEEKILANSNNIKPKVYVGKEKKVVVLDYGYSKEIVDQLRKMNCYVVVLPHHTSAQEILSYHPDGVILSDGILNPFEVDSSEVKKLFSKVAILGINFGQLILAISSGIKVNQLDYKCYSVNHPVKEIKSGTLRITSKKYDYNLDFNSVENSDFEITYIGVNQKSVEGIKHKDYPIYAIQFDLDIVMLREFIKVMKGE